MSRKAPLPAVAGPRQERDVTRGDATRMRLLTASIDVFGRLGFDGATTRALADAAGVNLQAIPYYFGGKDGLYVAAAEHIVHSIAEHVAVVRDRVRGRLAETEEQQRPLAIPEARALLTELVQTMAELFVSRDSESWARFVMREQMEPTEAFTRLYQGVTKPLFDTTDKLIAVILGEDHGSEHVRMRTLALLGGVMVFRMANAAALAHLAWKKVDAHNVDAVRTLAAELVDSIATRRAPS
jgi:TetR/AcrR family transcriptional regulator, regulator of cefoperazone and chloramphenicol sensitivity